MLGELVEGVQLAGSLHVVGGIDHDLAGERPAERGEHLLGRGARHGQHNHLGFWTEVITCQEDTRCGESAVTTWLHRIVINSCLDRMRRRSVRPVSTGSDERALDTAALGSAIPDPASDSDTSLDVLAGEPRAES